MIVFITTLVVVSMCALFARIYGNPVVVGEESYIAPNKKWVFLLTSILILVSGLRSNIGDTPVYVYLYKTLGTDLNLIMEGQDKGFYLFLYLLNKVSSDPQIMIFATALVTNALIIVSIYRYSKLFELGTYLYITMGIYAVTMNGIRQCIAAAIIFTSTKLLIDGKWKLYFLVVGISSTIHASALIMVLVYFIVRRKAWSRSVTFILLILGVSYIFLDETIKFAFSLMENTQYGYYKDTLFDTGQGANHIRVIIHAVPVVLAFIARNKISKHWRESDIFVNMALLNALFMLFATYNWVIARFCIYFQLYELILITKLVGAFGRKGANLLYVLVLIFYFLFYFYEAALTLNLSYESEVLGWKFP